MTSEDPHSGPGNHPADDTVATGDLRAELREVGPYTLRERLGAGGMGEVWRAEQTRPIRRTVALKLIKAGMDTEHVIARFEAERQALALMDHSSVAKVFDAGKTANGRPYFAMEYIRGVPITEHCDMHRLTVRQRLELFEQVCEGVQHAHQKAVIHRDLKPSNIMVAIQDDKAVPKIIDFGVARAMTSSLTEKTLYTAVGQLVGTPEYMSPEQADMSQQDIDTRTDVYALGVVLYELLAGALPFDSKRLREAGLEQARKTIREVEPPRPSTRVSSGGEDSTGRAHKRNTTPGHLVSELRGDLDWITMKALEKDRTRRYASASELSADVRRYRRNEPVVARPPSLIYRTQKFVRRNRVGVAVAAVAVILLLAFFARDRMQSARVAAERDRANEETARAKQASAFLADMLGELAPSRARASTLSAKDILDAAVRRAEEELTEQPLVRAQILSVVGRAYKEMGHRDEAVSRLEEALALTERELGIDHEDTIERMAALARTYADLQVNRFDEAEVLQKKLLEMRIRDLGWQSDEALKEQGQLAFVYRLQRRHEEARDLYTENLERWTALRGEIHAGTLGAASSLATEHWYLGEFKEAERRFLDVLEKQALLLGNDHPTISFGRNNLALVYRDMGNLERVLDLHTQNWESLRRTSGDSHPNTLWALSNVVTWRMRLGRYEGTGELAIGLHETSRQVYGEEHEETRAALVYVIWHRLATGQVDEAYARKEELLAIERAAFGSEQGSTLYNLACGEARSGRVLEAIDTLNAARQAGWKNAEHAADDDDLEILREEPAFVAVLEQMRSGS